MRRAATAMCVAGTVILAGCTPRLAPPDVAAVLTNPTAQSHAELVRVVAAAVHGAPVTIADSALTADGMLIVERARHQDARDMNLGGRETARPEHFQLVKSGSRC